MSDTVDLFRDDLVRALELAIAANSGALTLRKGRGKTQTSVDVFRLRKGGYRLYGPDGTGRKDATLAKGSLVDVLTEAKRLGYL